MQSDESQVAHAVGHLLSLAPHVKPPEWKQLCSVISVVRQHQQITYTHFEQILHLGTTSLMDMKIGLRQPNVEVLARLSIFSGQVIWEALVQSAVPPLHHPPLERPPMSTLNEKRLYLDYLVASTEPLPGLAYIAHQCSFPTVRALRKVFSDLCDILWQRIHDEQRQALEEALQQAVPVVLSEWTLQHRYSVGDLYHHFYELCCQITSRFQADKETRCRHYLQQLLQGEQPPSLNAISKTLGVGNYYLKQHFAEELQCLETRRQQSFQQDEVTARDYFKQLLESEDDASISLQQVAETLGKSVKYLKHTFPIESQYLLDRRRAYIAAQVDMTCQHIRQLVFDLHQQGIYPSVDRIHAAIGTWMVHGKAYRRAYIDAMAQCGYSPLVLK
jgi:AraC-like DNA-binding protein